MADRARDGGDATGVGGRPAPASRDRTPAAAVSALVAVTVVGTGDAAITNAAIAAGDAATGTGDGMHVAMRNVRFTPRSLSVRVGQVVTWTDEDRVPHDVVATSGADFDSGNLNANGAFSFRATAPGRIAYACTLHQGMSGTIDIGAQARTG